MYHNVQQKGCSSLGSSAAFLTRLALNADVLQRFLLQTRLRKDFKEAFFHLAEHDDSRENFFGRAVGRKDLARGYAGFGSRKELNLTRFAREGRRGEENAVFRMKSRGVLKDKERDVRDVDVGYESSGGVGSLNGSVLLNANSFCATRRHDATGFNAQHESSIVSNQRRRKEIERIDRKLEALADAIAEAGKSRTLLLKLKDLETQRDVLEDRLAPGSSLPFEVILRNIDGMRDNVLSVINDKKSTTDELRSALSLFVSAVITYPEGTFIIRHNLPGVVGEMSGGFQVPRVGLEPTT